MCQSSSFKGGIAPINGFHSVIDNPDPVKRVIPPMMTMQKIKKQPHNNQIATGRLDGFINKLSGKNQFESEMD